MAGNAAVCKKHKNTLAPDVIYKIHPAIGIARVGNAPSEFFIGPEIPGRGATGKADSVGTPVPPYKDGMKRIKRQAARFRIWKYVWNGKLCQYIPKEEIHAATAGIKKITWTVQLANRKASFFNFDGTNGERPPYGWNVKFSNALRNSSIVTAADRRAKLEIDPGPKSIDGANKSGIEFKKATAGIPIDYLGELRTDDKGRLLVLGGKGHSDASASLTGAKKPIGNYSNNDTWFDDVSDGPVTAQIEFKKGKNIPWEEIEGAWVLVGPPDFAPPIENLVTLYDTLSDVAVQHLTFPEENGIYEEYAPNKGLSRLKQLKADFTKGTGLTAYKVSFRREIYPIVQRVLNYSFVHKHARGHHTGFPWDKMSNPGAAGKAFRDLFFGWIRIPEGWTGARDPTLLSDPFMPKLLGDEEVDSSLGRPASAPGNAKEFLTLTTLQYAQLNQWWKGKFEKDGWPGSNNPADLPAPAAKETPEGLDRAALENCVGGAFFPGIEVGWQIRNPDIYSEPFRIDPWERDASGKIKILAGKPVPKEIQYGRPGDPGSTKFPMIGGFFSRQMALPWQADFLACSLEPHSFMGGTVEFGWWPAQRPDTVKVKATATVEAWARGFVDWMDMVDKWHSRGFVVKSGGEYLEDESP